jgi:hypothetical protein
MATETSASSKKSAPQSSSITTVWQWVCYGLWELALIALCVLLVGTLAYFFLDNPGSTSDYTFSIYFMAAVLCLLPPAFIVDKLYMKRESSQKHGFSAVIMVLNGVVVFLASIAAFITAVMTTLSIVVDGDSSAEKWITIVSALVIAKLGGLLFIRIINPERLSGKVKYFRQAVLIVAAIILIAACAGPVRNLFMTRADRVIEDNLSGIQSGIDIYTNDKKSLPVSLTDIDLVNYEKAADLVEAGKVTYKPNSKPAQKEGGLNGGPSTDKYFYQLCVTYKKSRGDQKDWEKYRSSSYTYHVPHPAGYYCYDLETMVYNY